jgi:hypothetical protein
MFRAHYGRVYKAWGVRASKVDVDITQPRYVAKEMPASNKKIEMSESGQCFRSLWPRQFSYLNQSLN